MKSGLLALSATLFTFSGITTAANDRVAAAWFAGWHESKFPPANVPWKKYTHMTYAFALTTPDPAALDESALTGLTAFVSAAHANGGVPMVSIGGWSGSRFFSPAVGSAENRTAFVKAVTNLAQKYKIGGVDFDWEYPSAPGIGCNSNHPNDTANFQLFLEQLRSDPVGKNLTVTAAAGIAPWLGPDGHPVTNVSGIAKFLDYVAVMNYDIWGSWSPTVGPNSPLNDTCGPAPRPGSAVSAIKAWKAAGMPADKIVLGVPSYGHSFRVSKKNATAPDGTLAAYPGFDANNQPAGDSWDGVPGETDVCGVVSTKPGGIIQYRGMVELGHIDVNGNPMPGRQSRFDNCSGTPFIYDSSKEIMVSYDNPLSMKMKGNFIKTEQLRGFAMWEVAGDISNGTSLIDSLRAAF